MDVAYDHKIHSLTRVSTMDRYGSRALKNRAFKTCDWSNDPIVQYGNAFLTELFPYSPHRVILQEIFSVRSDEALE
jgi:hypothetical protein